MANKNNAVYIDVEEFFENALRYYSMNNMAMNEGISRSTVLRWLNKLKNERLDLREKLRETWNIKQNAFLINREQGRTTYNFNDYAFHTFTPDSCYWLGMLASDGCVYEDRNKIYINAQVEDKEHIESFVRFIEYTGKIKDRPAKCNGKEYPSVYLELYSKTMKNRLIELGIVPDKSNKDIDYLSYIPNEYKIYFIFGYLDGDGGIYFTEKDNGISILGNSLFINSLNKFLSEMYLIDSNVVLDSIVTDDEENIIVKKYNLNIQQYYSMFLFCKEYLKYDSPYQLKRKKEKARKLLVFLEEKIQNNENLKYNNSHFIDLRKKKKYSNGKYIKIKKKDCPYCGTKITNSADMCVDCYNKLQRRVERPSREVLKEEIRTTSFLKLSEKYGVTDNAIKKWCKSYGLPYKKSEIKLISDEEWLKV